MLSDHLKQILNALSSLEANLSPKPDDIYSKLLKERTSEILRPLTSLLNISLGNGIVLIDWKMANGTPVFKKENTL